MKKNIEARFFRCQISGIAKPAVTNPRPSIPCRFLTISSLGWGKRPEIYGQQIPFQMVSVENLAAAIDMVYDFLFKNKDCYVVVAIDENKMGVVCFRLPVIKGFQPEVTPMRLRVED